MIQLRRINELLAIFERHSLLWVAALSIVVVLLEFISIGMVVPFIGLAADPTLISPVSSFGAACSRLSGGDHTQLIFIIGGGLCALFAVKAVGVFLLRRAVARRLMQAQRDLACSLTARTLTADFRVFLEKSPSVFVSTILHHTTYATRCLESVIAVAAEASLLLLLLLLSAHVEPRATVVGSVVLLAFGLVLKLLVVDPMRRLGQRRAAAHNRWAQLTYGLLSAIRDIRIMGLEEQLQRKLRETAAEYTDANARFLTRQTIPRLAAELGLVSTTVLAVVLVSRFGVGLLNSLPTLAAFAVVVIRAVPSFYRIYNALSQYNYCVASIQDLGETSSFLNGHQLRIETCPSDFSQEIRVSGLRYSYAGGKRPALDGVDLRVPKNAFVAIVGPSGSGKSTLLDVLAGLLPADQGAVLVDGNCVDPYHTDAIRRLVGYVPQEVTLLDDTLGFNIALSDDYRENISSIRIATEAAQVDTFIDSQPDGYETVAGERGVMMSGGQRQRIGIARALYRHPAILLLDEATSAVDPATEQQIIESIIKLSGSTTILFATHRLQTVQNCDTIVVLEHGRTVGQGTHEELLAACPVYQKLVATGRV